MGKPRKKDLPNLTHLAQPGAEIAVRVTPKARPNAIEIREGVVRISVTAAPENDKANDAVQNLLALAMNVAPSHLLLKRGQVARDKLFVYSGVSRS